MDGVLLDSEPLHTRATRLLLAEYGLDWDESESADYIGLTDVESFVALKARHRLEGDPREFAARYAERAIALLREEGRPMDGVPAVLRAVRERGYRVGLGSSSRMEVIEATLDSIGVRPLFDVVVSATEVPRGKPAPDVFLEVAKRLGVAPERCVVIEDSYNGVRAAGAAGMRCVAVPCGTTRHQDFSDASVVLDSLTRLLDCSLFAQ
jgi:HAD superfamily hydrolase (TIGR01509 family)